MFISIQNSTLKVYRSKDTHKKKMAENTQITFNNNDKMMVK